MASGDPPLSGPRFPHLCSGTSGQEDLQEPPQSRRGVSLSVPGVFIDVIPFHLDPEKWANCHICSMEFLRREGGGNLGPLGLPALHPDLCLETEGRQLGLKLLRAGGRSPFPASHCHPPESPRSLLLPQAWLFSFGRKYNNNNNPTPLHPCEDLVS